jgi:hypothetical protein
MCSNHKQCLSSSNVGDNPSSQPNIQVITKTWELKIGPIIIRGETCKMKWLLHDHKVWIMTEDNNPILKQPDMFNEVKKALIIAHTSSWMLVW